MKLHFRNYFVENEVEELEKALFRTLYFSTIFLVLLAIVFTWIETWSPFGVVVTGIYFFSIILYGIIVIRSEGYRFGYFLLCLFNNCIMMPAGFFLCGGMVSGMPIFFMLGLVTCALCVEQKLSLYSAVTSSICYVALFLFEVFDPERVKPLSDRSRVMDIVFSFVFCSVVYFLFMKSMMSGYYRMYSRQVKTLSKKNEVFRDMVDAEKERTAALHRMRHDLRHHTNVLVEMLEDNRSEEALAYLKNSLDADAVYDRKVFCMNGTLNGILNYISRKCLKNKVQLTVDADILENIAVDSGDLVAIAANVLENAVHGAVSSGVADKKIMFKAFCKAGKMVISCENSCSPEVIVENGMILNQSTGIQSILHGVERYDGTISYLRRDDLMTCHILLNLNEMTGN